MSAAGDADIIDMILAAEGSTYTDDPDDSGGPTKFGVTLAQLAAWRGTPVAAVDVAQLTRQEAEAIYGALYIRPFDGLPIGLRENVIDMGVNAGVSRAARLCQQLVGSTVDGKIGPQTIRLATDGRVWTELYSAMRIAFYEALIERKPSQLKYRNGWRARAMRFLTPPVSRGLGLVEMFMSPRVGKAYE